MKNFQEKSKKALFKRSCYKIIAEKESAKAGLKTVKEISKLGERH